jgi:hypothetical protein
MDKFKKWTWGLWYFIDICHNFHSSHRGWTLITPAHCPVFFF